MLAKRNIKVYRDRESNPSSALEADVKVKLSLCLTRYDAMKTYGVSALNESERSASGPGCFTPRERVHGNHCSGGRMGSTAGVDAVAKT
jgi:hypothetical protein